MKRYTADFETATWLKNESYVWAWAVCEIGNDENVIINNSMESFIDFMKKESGSIFYFHNLKFDGSFIIYYLLSNGFEYIEDVKQRKSNSFYACIKSGQPPVYDIPMPPTDFMSVGGLSYIWMFFRNSLASEVVLKDSLS